MPKYNIGGAMRYPHEEYNIEAANEEEAKQKFLEEFCKELASMSQPYTCPRDGAQMEAPFMDSGDLEIEWVTKE
mgnify:CR=1 FL=1